MEPEGPTNDVTVWRMRIECWTSKATCAHAHAHAHAPGQSHTRTHTMVSGTRLIVTLYYIACLVLYLYIIIYYLL
jgi:hypothetical protein